MANTHNKTFQLLLLLIGSTTIYCLTSESILVRNRIAKTLFLQRDHNTEARLRLETNSQRPTNPEGDGPSASGPAEVPQEKQYMVSKKKLVIAALGTGLGVEGGVILHNAVSNKDDALASSVPEVIDNAESLSTAALPVSPSQTQPASFLRPADFEVANQPNSYPAMMHYQQNLPNPQLYGSGNDIQYQLPGAPI